MKRLVTCIWVIGWMFTSGFTSHFLRGDRGSVGKRVIVRMANVVAWPAVLGIVVGEHCERGCK